MTIKKAFTVNYESGQIFQNVYGGFYQFEHSVWFNDEELAVYKHIWPFEISELTARHAEEFLTKFKPVSQADLQEAQKKSAEEFQFKIREIKTKAKKIIKTELLMFN